ncbi:uncharacterized protein LOC107799307 isoform X2 [Nicotiana tabacum]|uniref:Uncharacterized protein LOC107799307 isoform X2 n=2 Tax=Nicotiana tabacum TaxID=4097 RepID=A0AC58TYJ9_TOBAC|nr:PREDICTED: phosphatidylinositol glycan anchor biosynthesis class U protein-like isoform X2 [Nicotiana tabacum]
MKGEKQQNIPTKKPRFWRWAVASIIFRLILIYFPKNLNLATRPEVSTPVTSLRRLAEGYWLTQSSMSPYAGSMYHGSPLLLSVLGPLTMKKIEGQPFHLLCSLVSVIADFICAMLIRATGLKLRMTYCERLKLLGLGKLFEVSEILPSEDIAALVYLWNPFTIVTCVGFNTTPVENLFIILSLYGACIRVAPLAAFGWVIASHLSLYPAILIIPVILLLGNGPDATPRKLLLICKKDEDDSSSKGRVEQNGLKELKSFSWKPVVLFFVWAFIWTLYALVLCGIFMRNYGGLSEMFRRTYGFILTVKDLSPNIAIRLKHRPCFLAFVYMAICSMLKPYPSVGDSALYLALLALFCNELAEMQFSFFLFCGYVGVSLLSPVMHNLWIWRGTGNANFYFATGMAYACFQIVLVVESVSAMLNHDRKIRKLVAAT